MNSHVGRVRVALIGVALVLAVAALEVLALKLGSFSVPLPSDAATVAEPAATPAS